MRGMWFIGFYGERMGNGENGGSSEESAYRWFGRGLTGQLRWWELS